MPSPQSESEGISLPAKVRAFSYGKAAFCLSDSDRAVSIFLSGRIPVNTYYYFTIFFLLLQVVFKNCFRQFAFRLVFADDYAVFLHFFRENGQNLLQNFVPVGRIEERNIIELCGALQKADRI